MESILTSIKKLLGIAEEDTSFDADIIMHINSVFSVLTQIGVGPEEGFQIEDDTAKWNDYMQGTNSGALKIYVYQKVRLLFDPPTNSAVVDAINRTVGELEWRLYSAANKGEVKGQNG